MASRPPANPMPDRSLPRIGVDLGGTKIAALMLGPADEMLGQARADTPREDYEATLYAIGAVIAEVERQAGWPASPVLPVGVATPGSISPATGAMQNANSTWLNGRFLRGDLEAVLNRPVRCANDANCFALSEAHDGAAAGAPSVFGVIVGTGCGGGFVHDGRLIDGPRAIGGEWGHNPLPWAHLDEVPGPECWCGQMGCLETWLSGPALERDHAARGGHSLSAREIAAMAGSDPGCAQSLARHADRLARGLAMVVNILDPHVVVLGGGLSEMPHLYERLPGSMAPYIFSSDKRIDVRPPRHGPASGVRGAARLWDRAEA